MRTLRVTAGIGPVISRPARAVVLVLGFVVLVAVNGAKTGDVAAPLVVPSDHRAPAQEPMLPAVEPVLHPTVPAPWTALAARTIDRTSLAAEGVTVPPGGNVFAARIVAGGPSPAYMMFEAGGGAFSNRFYPASSIKVLAAAGALELAYARGFTGRAIVDGQYSLADYYDAAIRSSSNEDYDELVRIAGVDWLNEDFLPAHGYASTRIQDAYAEGDSVAESPPVHLTEHGEELTLPERASRDDYGCDAANCSTLADLVDSVRRVVLDDELPADERFAVAPVDVAGMQDALLGAGSWIQPGVTEALGTDAAVYSKPGWTSGYDCVDVGMVADHRTGDRYLIGVSAPDDGQCTMLATMAADVLTVLSRHHDGDATRTDGTSVHVVDGRAVP